MVIKQRLRKKLAEWTFTPIYNDELDSFRLYCIIYIFPSSRSLVHNTNANAYRDTLTGTGDVTCKYL